VFTKSNRKKLRARWESELERETKGMNAAKNGGRRRSRDCDEEEEAAGERE